MVLRIACFGKHLKDWIWMLVMPHGFTSPAAVTIASITGGGIDLCECGSGQKVGECECESKKAHDTLGIKYDSFGAILKNFG